MESASVLLVTTAVPSDVKCLVLTAAATGSAVSRSFDVTPSQPANMTAAGLPTGTVTLTEAAYNAACSQITAQTPLTWVSDTAVVVQLTAGQTTPVSIVLRRAGGAVVTTTFADNVDGGIPINNPPTIATAASASPNPVTGATTGLSVLAADDMGEANLTYTWATTGAPPAAVSFSANGTNASKTTTATFAAAGTYTFQVTVQDQGGLTVASAVGVTVTQTLTSIIVTPASATVAPSTSQQFAAVARDQFAANLPSQPTFTWTVSGGGTIAATGIFTAGTAAGGPYTVQAASGGIVGAATITVATAPTPTGIYRINAGSSTAVSPFASDAYGTGGTQHSVTNTINIAGVTNPAPMAVYQSERYGNSTYTFPGLVASMQYTVRLHFAELYWTAAGKRVFNVLINDAAVLSSFDVFATAGAQYKALVREFTATANASGQIVIKFNTVTDNATIEGIEILTCSGTGCGCSSAANSCVGCCVSGGCQAMPTWYRDFDADGFGDPTSVAQACTQPTGYVASKSDCCDKDPHTYPASNYCSTTANACGAYDYDCNGQQAECNAPVSTCPESGLCTTTGVCSAASCVRYGYNYSGFGCGIGYTYLVSTDLCDNTPSGCALGGLQSTGATIACH